MVSIRNIQIHVIANAGSLNIGKTMNIVSKDKKKEEQPVSIPPLPVPPAPPAPTISCFNMA